MKNKIMELRNTAVAKRKEAQSFAASADITSAKASLEEAKQADAEADMLQEILDSTPAVPEVNVKPENKKDPVHEFAQAVRRGFKNINNEGTGADGGYTVPEDIQTRIEKYREAKFSLATLVRSEAVTTNKGRRTFQTKAQHAGFSKVAEAGTIGAVTGPQFKVLNYSIDKFAGYLPVTNELLEDSDANITAVMVEWLGEEAIATDNAQILAKIGSKAETDLVNIDGIKKALNITLGQAYAPTSAIVTNDDGLNYLDTLKVSASSNEYLLKPVQDQTSPYEYVIAVGARRVPVVVVPNEVLASTPTYSASTATSVVSGKTYYTRSGSGTSESPYVYTKVASPTGNPSTSSYYEMDAFAKMPFIVGDLKEANQKFDRKQLSLLTSNTAAIGEINAFEQDLTIFRGIMRADYKVRDEDAFVNGYIQPSAGE